MLLTARPLDWRRHGGLAGPGRGGRLHSAIRPRRAIQLQAGAKKAAQPIEADLARLYSDPTYQVERDIGPVELRALKGKASRAAAVDQALPPAGSATQHPRPAHPRNAGIGRSVHALRDLSTGELLLISQPLGSWLTGAVGEALRPSQLLDHFQHTSRLTPADTYRLALLYDGSETSKARKLSGWKELSAAQASAKASRQVRSRRSGLPRCSTNGLIPRQTTPDGSTSGIPPPTSSTVPWPSRCHRRPGRPKGSGRRPSPPAPAPRRRAPPRSSSSTSSPSTPGGRS